MEADDGRVDRRLEGRVRELENKVHTLELSDAQHKIEISGLKGEINGLRSSSASSFEVKAASDLLRAEVKGQFEVANNQLGNMHKDLTTIKTIGWSFIFIIVAGFIGAIATVVYRVQ
jgi:hypothetical protein